VNTKGRHTEVTSMKLLFGALACSALAACGTFPMGEPTRSAERKAMDRWEARRISLQQDLLFTDRMLMTQRAVCNAREPEQDFPCELVREDHARTLREQQAVREALEQVERNRPNLHP
jgi:hypothetical protein